ncbi:uncharacterized protein EI90DRAFT_3050099 [Cantharellus anzutake]|uniref:uncharacterized protein n=1 Tax=Cantharellus anzutake TaxID=1750568 RepID=UPI0019050E4E|nr:uncharacterized protein EI90DRAFT_3050099 [Cantharellus anzutake]KAF8334753.1 hypothetical protein EI90DRAFT_3050099 [Cantharellus anzutake]
MTRCLFLFTLCFQWVLSLIVLQLVSIYFTGLIGVGHVRLGAVHTAAALVLGVTVTPRYRVVITLPSMCCCFLSCSSPLRLHFLFCLPSTSPHSAFDYVVS